MLCFCAYPSRTAAQLLLLFLISITSDLCCQCKILPLQREALNVGQRKWKNRRIVYSIHSYLGRPLRCSSKQVSFPCKQTLWSSTLPKSFINKQAEKQDVSDHKRLTGACGRLLLMLWNEISQYCLNHIVNLSQPSLSHCLNVGV